MALPKSTRKLQYDKNISKGRIIGFHPAIETRRYKVTPSLIG